jgi:hypothetical protein
MDEESENIISTISDIMLHYESVKNKIKDIVIDFNISETISLPTWIKEENLNMVLGAGDCVINNIIDIERINSFNIFVCLPEAPLDMIVKNIDYIIKNESNKIICFIDLTNKDKVEKFIQTFENQINMIGFGGGHFVSLPNHKCFGKLLKPDGYSLLPQINSGLLIEICNSHHINDYFIKINFKISEEQDFVSGKKSKITDEECFQNLIVKYHYIIESNREKLNNIFNFDEIFSDLEIPGIDKDSQTPKEYFEDLFKYIYNLMFISSITNMDLDMEHLEYRIFIDDKKLLLRKKTKKDGKRKSSKRKSKKRKSSKRKSSKRKSSKRKSSKRKSSKRKSSKRKSSKRKSKRKYLSFKR